MELLKAIEEQDIEGVTNFLATTPHLVNFYDHKSNDFPLGVAARVGNLELVKLLLQHGANLRQATNRGCTVLQEAAKGPSVEVFEYLKDNFDLATTSLQGWTLLHYSAAYGSEEMTKHLIELGIEVNKMDNDDFTPLSLASKNTYSRIVSMLIDAGADVNTVDKFSQTSLHKACSVGALQVVKYLIAGGARLDIRDSNGLTAFDVADEVGQTECAIYLWENGAVAHSSAGFAFGSLEWKRPTFRGDVSGGYGHKSRIETDLYVFNTTESNFETLIDVHHPNSANISNMVLDAQNSSPLAIISDDGLKVFCSNDKESRQKVSAVITNKGYSANVCPFGYFEVYITNGGKRNEIGIGLVNKGYSMGKHPGWEEFSYGYHGDDGRAFHNVGNGAIWGQMYGTGDTIGCGINFTTREVFWTKNGKLIGVAYKDAPLDMELFPMIGLTTCASIEVTFDNKKRPFKYNFETELYTWKQIVCAPLEILANLKETPPLYRRYLGLSAEMYPLGNDKLLFWVDDMAILDTSSMTWEIIETGDDTKPENMTHFVDSKLYTFSASEGAFKYMTIGEWEWHRWETFEEISILEFCNAPRIYSAVVSGKIYLWLDSDPEDHIIYIYNTTSCGWSSCKPKGRVPTFSQYSCTPLGSQILTFGGWDNRKQQNDIWCLDTEKMIWHRPHVTGLSVPRPRNNHTAVAVDNRLYCIGGWDGRGFLSDVDILECSPLVTRSALPLFQFCFNNTIFSDVELVTQGKTLPAHKIILASRSQYFRQKFELDPKLDTLDLTQDVGTFDALFALVEYIYTESLNLQRIGAESSHISYFLAVVLRVLPEFKDTLTEKLILTRVRIPSHIFQGALNLGLFLQTVDMAYAWNSKQYSDVTIIANGVPFHLHKAIICSRCNFFRALCGTGLRESQSNQIYLNEDNPQVLGAILEFIYTDNLELTEENHALVVPILIAANQYSVVGCKELMEDIIGCNLDVENVLSLALLAEQHEASRLAKHCWDFISHPQNFEQVFSHLEYFSLKEQVHELFGQDVIERIANGIREKEEEERQKEEEDVELEEVD